VFIKKIVYRTNDVDLLLWANGKPEYWAELKSKELHYSMNMSEYDSSFSMYSFLISIKDKSKGIKYVTFRIIRS
jgi:hypothetical protein